MPHQPCRPRTGTSGPYADSAPPSPSTTGVLSSQTTGTGRTTGGGRRRRPTVRTGRSRRYSRTPSSRSPTVSSCFSTPPTTSSRSSWSSTSTTSPWRRRRTRRRRGPRTDSTDGQGPMGPPLASLSSYDSLHSAWPRGSETPQPVWATHDATETSFRSRDPEKVLHAAPLPRSRPFHWRLVSDSPAPSTVRPRAERSGSLVGHGPGLHPRSTDTDFDSLSDVAV